MRSRHAARRNASDSRDRPTDWSHRVKSNRLRPRVTQDPPSIAHGGSRTSFFLAVAALFAGVLWFWLLLLPAASAEHAVHFQIVPGWDLYSFFFPKYTFGSQELAAGRLPLWNRFEFAGLPFLGSAQPATLYPPRALAFAIFEPARAMQLLLLVHLLALPILFAVFVRALGVGWLGCLAGGAYWSFNLAVLSSLAHPDRLSNLVWFPLIFLFGDRLLRGPTVPSFVALAAVYGVQLSAGNPEYPFQCAVLLGVHALVVTIQTRPRNLWRAPTLVALALSCGAMLAAVQLLPFAEVLANSERSATVSKFLVGLPAFGSYRAIAWLIPFGLPPLIGLLALGVTRRRAAAPAIELAVCVAIVWVGWRYLRLLPGMGAMRHPFVWTLSGQFFAAWLIALGADRLSSRPRAARGPGLLERALIVAIGVVWALLCVLPNLGGLGSSGPVAAVLVAARANAASSAAGVLGVAGGLVLIVAGLLREGEGRAWAASAAVVLFAAGQLSAFPFGSAIAPLRPQPGTLTSFASLSDDDLDGGRVFALDDAASGEALTKRRENVLGAAGSIYPARFREVALRLEVNVALRRVDWEALARSKGYLDTLDVRYVVAPRRFARMFAARGLVDTGRGNAAAALFRNSRQPARAWAVYGVETVDSREAALDRLLAADFDPRTSVIVEAPLGRSYPPLSPMPSTPAAVRYDGPNVVTVDVDMNAAGVLVLADACYPGWQAQADGKDVTILCANYLVRAVELGPGPHRVRFEYRPIMPAWGAGVSTATGVGLIALLVFRRRHRIRRIRRGPRSSEQRDHEST